MTASKKDFEKFASEYQKEEKEILILTSDAGGGAGRSQGEVLWTASKYFLAYVDLDTNELKKGDGRVVWSLTQEEEEKRAYFKRFKNGCIYKLKVRELADKTVPEGRSPSYYNRFMIVEDIEEDVKNNELLTILEEYRKPIIIEDKILGKFQLNKDLACFNGEISWLGEDIGVSLDVNVDSKGTWTKALKALKILFDEQKQRDLENKTFAAKKLVDLANEWQQDEDEESDEITESEFADRMSLSELVVSSGGSFTAYYNDDDMFWGHAITVYGSIKKGATSAQIEG